MAAKLRQEVTLNSGETASSNVGGDWFALSQLDTTQYSGTVTYYFEVVAKSTNVSTNATISLRRSGTTTDDATITVTHNTAYARQRVSFTPPAGQTTYFIHTTDASFSNVNSGRIIVLQSDAASITSTETQIEIGNTETAKVNTVAGALSNPKYWKYNAAQWDGTKTFFVEITWSYTGTGSGTVKIQQDGGADNFTFADLTTIVSAGTASVPTRVRVAFTPTDGRNYQISTVNSSSMGSLSIYNAKIVVDQVGATTTSTYYFNASQAGPTDAGAIWLNDANAFDGNTGTAATTTTPGTTSTNLLAGTGTTAPSSSPSGSDVITLVEVRGYATSTGALAELNVLDGATKLVNGTNITAQPSSFGTDTAPATGRTWAKLNSLIAQYWLGSGGTAMSAFRAEIQVTYGNGTTALTKVEGQYLLANTSFGGSTGLKNYDTLYDPAEWDAGSGSITYIHEGDGAAAGAGIIKLQSDPHGTPTDVTNSTVTTVIQREDSATMTMPVASATIDVNVTTTGTLNASRILARWAYVGATATTKTETGTARLTATTVKTETGTARITATTTKTETGVSRLQKSATQTETGVARVTATTPRTETGVANIRNNTLKTDTGVARLTATTLKTESGVSRIQKSATQTEAATARLTASATKAESGTARITATTTKTETGVAAIAAAAITTTKTETGTARLTATTTKTETGVSRLQKSVLKTETATARVTGITAKTETGTARITATTPKTESGTARLTATTTKTETGISRLQQSVTKTETGLSRISGITPKTETGTARITATTTKTESATARIAGTTTKTETGVAAIVAVGTSNLVSYWKLDESSGTAVDSVGSNNLTNNNTTTYAAAKINNGATFARASSQSLTKASPTGVDGTTLASDFTISAWIKIASSPSSGQAYGIVTRFVTGTSGAGVYDFFYCNESGIPRFQLFTHGAGEVTERYDVTLTTSTWYHAAVTVIAGTVRFYLNGVGAAPSSGSFNTPSAGTGSLSIGRGGMALDGTNGYMDGSLDEIGIWTRGLSSAEISALYNGGTGLQYPFTSTTATKTETGTARITATTLQTETATARITATTTKTEAGTARLQKTATKTETGAARITATATKTETATARLTATTSKTETGVARLTATTTKTETGISRITASTTRTETGTARLTATTQKTETGVSRLTATTLKTETAVARLTATTLKTETGAARITATTTKTESGVARLTATTFKTETGVSRITRTVPKTETGTARVTATTQRTETGIAHIIVTGTTQQTETGVANIRTNTLKTETGTARITTTATKTETGTARITATALKTETGVARLTATADQTLTGTANIAAAVHSNGNYFAFFG